MSHFTYGIPILEITYIVASVLFILGLKMLSHPLTARRGNILAAFGMGFAIIATIAFHKKDGEPIGNIPWILLAIIIGTVIGWFIARRVKMTAMPQLVSFFNGMGGAAAALISMMEFPHIRPEFIAEHGMANGHVLAILLGLVIGTISWAGSMIAFGKLDGKIGDMRIKAMRYVNMIMMAIIVGLVIFIMTRNVTNSSELSAFVYILFSISLVYGVLFVMPIGGADMPVVISLLNSFTGVAAAMGGFLYNNQAMLTGGILVGSAGTILTVLMCKAMNRSLINVIAGVFGGGGKQGAEVTGTIKEITLSDAAVLLSYSKKVVIVPGYGLAVAQAQHSCHELDKLLTEKGVEVRYAIHPVAGRMPGHMNVLLAEADVPYEMLVESEEINPDMPSTDVVVVIGANDVVNPAAEDDPSSPIYGMPIVKVRDAKNIIVMKRGMGKGYAAIENLLFFHDKTRMLFGDAKTSLQNLINEVKNL
ncbi:MAG TPA: NAD(P)(+) transhydrogenase (Re/Si-specific) subunit beta [Bacteroidales bacterium]|jgi:NAD(P) transhydrogenase subunit beta|nr:NAD(P)(+) transhydrogenase (Re/Si-specific) subunit beta [Bacteroidales bacterium]OQB64040.1 MAG: NAD(P) transhydrogenase subunit beta [Bacteroidetes bacterium ADurb.Bin145]HOU02174.1 NAD(P)(+) transhydrogenase (Re/Si-specific) subunit beta [Bacteroidales bacterium]HQG64085.1 NAD(P)(+) transhydrogenase (Re/Si-specific) subunit beta [Bacteroidales bacterium]HQK68224.1 NAD(P)(+) transhydrogenase (Re/Si-specific) subunit beta [Bacteroidales bacterium]